MRRFNEEDNGEAEDMVLDKSVDIPSGDFRMAMAGVLKPVHIELFSIDRHPVTNKQYKQFTSQTGHRQPYADKEGITVWDSLDFNADDQPVVGVDWSDALAYALWAGKRLPTEAEWEKAARGGRRGKRYPWGDEVPTSEMANYGGNVGKTTVVGSYPANEYELYDMAGNVFEWCLDTYREQLMGNKNPIYAGSGCPYTSLSSSSGPVGVLRFLLNVDNECQKVVRGGSWASGVSSSKDYIKIENRSKTAINYKSTKVGFRCVSIPDLQGQGENKFKTLFNTHFLNGESFGKQKFSKYNKSALYHITEQRNVATICQNGILNHREVRTKFPNFIDISDPEVQQRRGSKIIYKHNLHEYVPLFLKPQGPMLYKKFKSGIQDQIVMLEICPSIVDDYQFALADGNSADQDTKFYKALADLQYLPWDVIDADRWAGERVNGVWDPFDKNKKEENGRKRSAELLIYPQIDPGYIVGIHCRSKSKLANSVILCIEQAGKPLYETPEFYF